MLLSLVTEKMQRVSKYKYLDAIKNMGAVNSIMVADYLGMTYVAARRRIFRYLKINLLEWVEQGKVSLSPFGDKTWYRLHNYEEWKDAQRSKEKEGTGSGGTNTGNRINRG